MAYMNATTAATLGVLGVLAAGGGTVVAAQQSGPGDLLYPLRVNITGEADASAEADLEGMQEAYEEAMSLEADGELSADTKMHLAERYGAHLQAIQETIADLEADGNAAAAADLRSELSTRLQAVGTFFLMDEASSEASASSADEESSDDLSLNGSMDAHVSAATSASADVNGDVQMEYSDTDSDHMESSDGSVRADADATSTVRVNVN